MHWELVDKLQRTAVTPTLSCGVAPSMFLRLAQLGLAQLTLALAARNSTKSPREEVVDGGTLGCHSIVDIGKRIMQGSAELRASPYGPDVEFIDLELADDMGQMEEAFDCPSLHSQLADGISREAERGRGRV